MDVLAASDVAPPVLDLLAGVAAGFGLDGTALVDFAAVVVMSTAATSFFTLLEAGVFLFSSSSSSSSS